jgi:DNA-directed RNA polymerase specialized sigma24 family protein
MTEVLPPTAFLGAPLTEYLEEAIPRVAASAHQRYRYIPAEDYAQSVWLAVLSKPHRFAVPWEKGEYGVIKARLWDAVKALTAEDDRFRRAQRAAEAGYTVDDIAFYSTGLLGLLLPALIESEWNLGNAMQQSGTGVDAAGVFIRSSDPFSGAENYLVMLADIKAAWERLTEGQRRLLTAYYGCYQEDTEEGRWERDGLAASMGLTGNALRVRVHRALERLQDELGGADPWRH